MDVVRKDATIVNTDDAFPGSFEVILSAPTKDRDGDTLSPDEWKQPLPEHITFDADHGMSVASTVGSGRPRLEADGTLRVSGTYSSLPRAQEVRTLVNEGHINRTSVAFITEKTHKDGVTAVTRELLNGAFVAVPSNREAAILASKTFTVKAGRRNSSADQMHLDEIARHAVALGATITGGDTASNEDVAAGKSITVKDTDGADPASMVQQIDATLDQIPDLLDGVDVSTLPAAVQQALSLALAAGAVVDELMDATGIPDPDDEDDSGADPAPDAAAAGKAATATGAKNAPVEADSIDQQVMAARKRAYYVINLTEGN